MATMNFLYRSRKDKAFLTARILFRVGTKDFTFDARTKIEVTKEYWERYHNQKRIKDIDILNTQNTVNNKINDIENHVIKAFNSIDVSYINKSWLENEIHRFYNPNNSEVFPTELVKYMDVYAKFKKSEVTDSTLKKINVIKQLVIRYQESTKKILHIKDIDLLFKTEFENYCLENNYAPNTVARAIRFVKTICRHAKANAVESSYQLDSIKTKYLKVEALYLDENELEKINKATYKQPYLENAKDWLIISCYCGQRISDFMKFTKEKIRYEDGKPLIEFTQVKTNKIMTIPLHKKILEILDKRNGNFPTPISDQKYNDYIKKVCKKAKIKNKVTGSKLVKVEDGFRKVTDTYEKWELVSSHIGRRSFATNFYGKIPTSLLIGATGHSTEAMFLNYIGKTDTQKAKQLADYF